jgi:hypothetical protein
VNQKNNNKMINNNKRTVWKKNKQKRTLNAEKNSKKVNENENLLSIELFVDFVFNNKIENFFLNIFPQFLVHKK